MKPEYIDYILKSKQNRCYKFVKIIWNLTLHLPITKMIVKKDDKQNKKKKEPRQENKMIKENTQIQIQYTP